MTINPELLYLGNDDEEYCGFTVGNKYKALRYNTEDSYIMAFDDNSACRHIINGVFHKFKILDDDDDFVIENESSCMASVGDKKLELRYYINGHEVDIIEFGNVRYTVDQLDEDGVKCDTIKFEVKFQ